MVFLTFDILMAMGSPELPHEDENNITRPSVNSLPMHGGNTAGGTSDDSDNENANEDYDGYQPLALDEDTMEYTNDEDNEDNTGEDNVENDDFDYSAFNANTVAPETDIHVPSIDAEIESNVWNAPRPESTDIELDSTRTAQIMSAMAQFSIPSTAIPSWAQGINEDKWKEDLLERIRQRQTQRDTTSD